MHKKSFGVFVISLLMFSLFVGVVSAQLGPPADTGTGFCQSSDPISQFFCRLFGDWSTGAGVSQSIARFFLGVIIAILVYGVSDNLPGLKEHNRAPLRWIISIIVAFLGTAYLSGTELMLIISQYNALGFALGAALPLLIVTFFTFDILSRAGSSEHHVVSPRLVAHAIWILFAVFMVYRVFTVVVPAVGGLTESFRQPIGIGYWSIIAICVVVTLFMNMISHYILKEKIRDINNRVNTSIALGTAVDKAREKQARVLAGEDETSGLGGFN